jgi:threonine/homoserine/homoserine lactone efflux protein
LFRIVIEVRIVNRERKMAPKRLTLKGKRSSFAPVTFSVAFAIGFSVASIPGPTIIVIATETLRKGAKAGMLTMLAAPLLDALIMLPLGLFLQATLFSGRGAIVLGLFGTGLLVWLGLQSIQAGIRETPLGLGAGAELPQSRREIPSFWKGVLTHMTSPYPYLYWGTVGASFIHQALEEGGPWLAARFPLGFWFGTSVFTLLVIYVLTQGKRLLPPRFEPYLHHLSGIMLIAGGILLATKVWQGFF